MTRLLAPRLFAPLALTAALWGTTALAQATPEGAEALTAVLQTYLGATPGVVTVTPQGEAYGVKLDAAPLLAKLPAGVESSATPVEFTLTDNGDGTWDYEQDQSLNVSVNVPGEGQFTISATRLAGTGTFDSSLQTFSTSHTEASGITVDETFADPSAGEMDVHYTIASASFDTTAKAGADGGVDQTTTGTMEGLSETIALPPMAEGAPAMPLTLTAATYQVQGGFEGFRPDAIYKMLAFFVAHPDKAAIAADQAALKTIVGDGLPLFAHMTSDATISDIAVDSPVGPFAVEAATVTVEANGILPEGLVREAFVIEGLQLPPGLVPDWATGLVPTDVSLDFMLKGFDLEAPVKLFLAAADLAKEPPVAPEVEQQLLAALLPDGTVDVSLAPGQTKAPLYTLDYVAGLTYGPAMMAPTGKAEVKLTGLDAIQTALQAAPPEVAEQAGPMIAMAQGMAKPGDEGQLVWEVEMTPEGALMVNGMNMGGGQ